MASRRLIRRGKYLHDSFPAQWMMSRNLSAPLQTSRLLWPRLPNHRQTRGAWCTLTPRQSGSCFKYRPRVIPALSQPAHSTTTGLTQNCLVKAHHKAASRLPTKYTFTPHRTNPIAGAVPTSWPSALILPSGIRQAPHFPEMRVCNCKIT